MVSFQQRMKSLKSEIEALKTASLSVPDGIRTTTKTINMTAKMTVYATYISGYYFIECEPLNFNEMIFSTTQKKVAVSDDVIVKEAIPRMLNGKNGIWLEVGINIQRQQAYLDSHTQGDIITKNISIEITASDDFVYTITETTP